MKKHSSAKKAGLPPGSIIHLGQFSGTPVNISVIEYDPDTFIEQRQVSPVDCSVLRDKPSITWFNVDGVHDTELIEQLGRQFRLHPLILEDIVNTDHRPKIEEADDYLYFTFKMLMFEPGSGKVLSEQVSIVLGTGFVLSFQEQPGDVFGPVRQRIAQGKGRIRKRGTDYLVYALVDTVVDSYFLIADTLEARIAELEEQVDKNPHSGLIAEIQDTRKQLVFVRQAIAPLKDAVGYLEKDESELIEERTRRYLRDVYDHIIHIIDSLEIQREILNGIRDSYHSTISTQLNQVMKVLTIIATIFIPLTYIAGIYGMNFEFMPELGWKWSYPAVWLVMLSVFAGMIVYFRRKKWL
ncbi:MAG: magnesium/cobalt transporter CorA [Candidatus Neomarinimicrobiota bacterium]